MAGRAHRDDAIDAARTVACALVVLMHVNAYTRAGLETWWPGGYAFAPFYCLTVPAFLVIAGFLQAGAAGDDSAAWLAGRLRRLLLPFVCWNAIMLALGFAAQRSPAELLVDLVTGVQHLYYLGVLAQLTIAWVLLKRWRGDGGGGGPLLAAALVSTATLALSDWALWSGRDGLGFTEGWLRRLALPWAIFFFFGAWLRRRGSLALSTRGLLALAVASAAGYLLYRWGYALEERSFGYAPRTELLLAGLPFQLLAGWLLPATLAAAGRRASGRRLRALLATPAPDTYGIYLAHFGVLMILSGAWMRLGHAGASALQVPVLWAAVWLVSAALVRAIRAVPVPGLGLLLLGERASTEKARSATGLPLTRGMADAAAYPAAGRPTGAEATAPARPPG